MEMEVEMEKIERIKITPEMVISELYLYFERQKEGAHDHKSDLSFFFPYILS